MQPALNARTLQLAVRLVALAVLILIALAIKGVPASQAAGLMPSFGAVAPTMHEGIDLSKADGSVIETGASVAACER